MKNFIKRILNMLGISILLSLDISLIEIFLAEMKKSVGISWKDFFIGCHKLFTSVNMQDLINNCNSMDFSFFSKIMPTIVCICFLMTTFLCIQTIEQTTGFFSILAEEWRNNRNFRGIVHVATLIIGGLLLVIFIPLIINKVFIVSGMSEEYIFTIDSIPSLYGSFLTFSCSFILGVIVRYTEKSKRDYEVENSARRLVKNIQLCNDQLLDMIKDGNITKINYNADWERDLDVVLKGRLRCKQEYITSLNRMFKMIDSINLSLYTGDKEKAKNYYFDYIRNEINKVEGIRIARIEEYIDCFSKGYLVKETFLQEEDEISICEKSVAKYFYQIAEHRLFNKISYTDKKVSISINTAMNEIEEILSSNIGVINMLELKLVDINIQNVSEYILRLVKYNSHRLNSNSSKVWLQKRDKIDIRFPGIEGEYILE